MVIKCLVIIPHYTLYNNVCFLNTCVNQVLTHKHKDIETIICVVEQSNDEIKSNVKNILSKYENITVLDCEPIDAGYPIDYALEYYKNLNLNIDYVCTLDADAFVVSNMYLYLPIKLIETYGYCYIGSSTDLAHWGYNDRMKKIDENTKEWQHINNYYRVSKFSTILKCSEDVGHLRLQNRHKINKTFVKTLFDEIKECDNGVIAQWYSSYINQGEKLSLEIISRSGLCSHGIYGMNIENMVYHVVFGYREVDTGINGYVSNTDEKYVNFAKLFKYNDIIPESDIINNMKNSEIEKNGRNLNYLEKIPQKVNEYINDELKNITKYF
jgi:hypothetical protein